LLEKQKEANVLEYLLRRYKGRFYGFESLIGLQLKEPPGRK